MDQAPRSDWPILRPLNVSQSLFIIKSVSCTGQELPGYSAAEPQQAGGQHSKARGPAVTFPSHQHALPNTIHSPQSRVGLQQHADPCWTHPHPHATLPPPHPPTAPPFPTCPPLPGSTQVAKGRATQAPKNHSDALQAYSNGEAVPYGATLRVVKHTGGRAPAGSAAKTQKPPVRGPTC